MHLFSVSLLLGCLVILVHAAGFEDVAAQLPKCGLKCIQDSIPNSPCSLTNSTCLCTDPTLATLTQECVTKSCTVKESLTMMGVQKHACGVPFRSGQTRFKVHVIVGCTLGEISIIMRLWSRFKIKGRLGMDDYLILISAAGTVPFLYLGLRLTKYGFGLNIWDIQPVDNLYEFSKAFYIDELVYNTILYTTKLSLLCFLAGIFPSRSFKNMVIATGVFALACYIVTIIVTALQCLPVSYTWTNWDGEHKGRCTDLNAQTYAFAAFNMGCDIIILILPLKELSRLQVKGNQKIQLFIIFSFGIVVTTLSLIRIPSMASIGKTDNPTYDNIDIAIWSVWECELGMMCANLPAISHLFKKMFPNLLSSIVGKVSSARTTKHTGNSLGGSWARSHPGRSKTDDKEYYELDERSLIGKGPEGGSSANITATGG